MSEDDEKRRKFWLLIVIALLVAFLAIVLAQNAQNTADINNVFEIVVNNTDLGSMGTGERVAGTKYFANDSPLYIEIITHTVNTGVDVVFNFSINDTQVWAYDKRTAIADEHHSVVQIVPKFSSYEFNKSTSIHHYEWREYPILSGKNGTLSVNQTFIVNQTLFNKTYDLTTKSFDSNYSAQTFPNASIYGLADILNSSKVNKTGDTMTGLLNASGRINTTLINITAPVYFEYENYTTSPIQPINSYNIINYTVKYSDPYNTFDGKKFTAPMSGYYSFDFSLRLIGNTGTETVGIAFFKNGNQKFNCYFTDKATALFIRSCHAVIFLNYTETLDTRISGTSASYQIYADSSGTSHYSVISGIKIT